jgi:hypothetical protein
MYSQHVNKLSINCLEGHFRSSKIWWFTKPASKTVQQPVSKAVGYLCSKQYNNTHPKQYDWLDGPSRPRRLPLDVATLCGWDTVFVITTSEVCATIRSTMTTGDTAYHQKLAHIYLDKPQWSCIVNVFNDAIDELFIESCRAGTTTTTDCAKLFRGSVIQTCSITRKYPIQLTWMDQLLWYRRLSRCPLSSQDRQHYKHPWGHNQPGWEDGKLIWF